MKRRDETRRQEENWFVCSDDFSSGLEGWWTSSANIRIILFILVHSSFSFFFIFFSLLSSSFFIFHHPDVMLMIIPLFSSSLTSFLTFHTLSLWRCLFLLTDSRECGNVDGTSTTTTSCVVNKVHSGRFLLSLLPKRNVKRVGQKKGEERDERMEKNPNNHLSFL